MVLAASASNASRRAPSGPRPDGMRAVVVAALVVVTFESWRLLFPHVYGLKERASLAVTAAVALATAAAGVAAPLVRRLAGVRATGVVLVALGLWRGACVFGDPVPLVGAVVGAALAVVAVVLVLTAPAPGTSGGLLAGLTVDLLLVASFASWDPIWQRTTPSAVAGLVLAAVLVVGGRARFAPAAGGPRPIGVGGGVALGAVALFEVLFLANPSFLASTGQRYPSAVALAAAGFAAVAGGSALRALGGRAVVPVAAAILGACGYALASARGVAVGVLVITAQAAVGVVASAALASKVSGRMGPTELALAGGFAVPVVVTLLYQLHYDAPLPFDNRYLVLAAGVAAALAAVAPVAAERSAPHRTPHGTGRVALAAGVLATASLAVPLALAATEPERPEAVAAATSLRIVQWNVHQAVSGDGALDPASIADAIERQGRVDVIVLNEVGRGWPLSGQLDLATWLSRRLGLRFVWAGAASDQFGNLVLSRLPLGEPDVTTLPVVEGMQGRSALHVTVPFGTRPVDIVATHLQHRNDADSMAVRLAELRTLAERWTGRDVVLAGDLNPRQGDAPAYPERRPEAFEEIRLLLDAGFTTAADLTACAEPTSNRNCSDYVFVGGALRATTYAVVATGVGDHRLIVSDLSRA